MEQNVPLPQILKKEGDLLYQYKITLLHSYRGNLVLTKTDLYFFFLSSSGKSTKMLQVPLQNIVSVNIEKVDLTDFLSVLYRDGTVERSARFVHRNKGQLLFSTASPNHFISWEQLINSTRFAFPADTADAKVFSPFLVEEKVPPKESPKSRRVALLLCFFLGSLGVHRFYVGKVVTGTLMILTLGGFGVWWLLDLVAIATGSFKDKQGRPLVRWTTN